MSKLTDEAWALLATASNRQPVTIERARQFAQDVLEDETIARLALEVLEDSKFIGARIIRLAEAVIDREDKNALPPLP